MLENDASSSPWTVLSIKTPWSYLVCSGLKDVENRSTRTNYRGRVYIHSSGDSLTASQARKEIDTWVIRKYPEFQAQLQAAENQRDSVWMRNRAIIGHVDIVDCIEDSDSPWASDGQYHWLLSNPVLFDEPITDIPGRLGLWKFNPVKHREYTLKPGEAMEVHETARPARAYTEHPFTTTDQHAQFWAWDLSKKSSADSYEKIAASMMGAQVDLNPHQVDAALFALKSPLSKGALLADEVGLGKTIEAGIILSQKWAEHKRKILLVLPATLRKQWSTELAEKFFLPSVILENKSFKEAEAAGIANPFNRNDAIVLTSYQFAAKKAGYVQQVDWNLVVIDEAHRVRNSWQKSNQMGRTLKTATAHARKILLTATPLQNTAMELFGLLSFIDPHAFGSEDSFRAQYVRLADEGKFNELRQRIKPFFHRTLRRQVLEYIKYTKRIALTETYTPSTEEQSFYDDFTEWLASPDLLSLPKSQRQLMTLVLHKLLASSTFALESVLAKMIARLEERQALLDMDDVADDLDGVELEAEDWEDDGLDTDKEAVAADIKRELVTLRDFQRRVSGISENAKGNKLLTALGLGFKKMKELSAADKAIIFTESRRTQKYLLDILSDSPYAGQVVLFNGKNDDPEAKRIYKEWLERNKGSDRISGSPSADMRAALVDQFKNHARIMIATEAAAEGVNLQFCSLLVNFDLPWNPQRIEQRIGRCHRYGQKFDVVVVNFLNTKNRADERVYELLNTKLQLFEGVFGASDEVLGALGSGVDFERRILGIYQTCRTKQAIDAAFGQLQLELEDSIAEQMSATKRKVLENLDEEVHQRLKLRKGEALDIRNAQERALWHLSKHSLGATAQWQDAAYRFTHKGESFQINPSPEANAHSYRIQHPLAQSIVERWRSVGPSQANITFHYTGKPVIGALEDLIGHSGWLQVEVLLRQSEQEQEELLIIAAITDSGSALNPEVAAKLFQLPGTAGTLALSVPDALDTQSAVQRQLVQGSARERQQAFFAAEIDKLELWADDLKAGLEHRIKELEGRIKETRKASTLSSGLEEKLDMQKQVKELEAERNKQRRRLFDAQDEVDAKRENLIADIEQQLQAREELRSLMTLRWGVEG